MTPEDGSSLVEGSVIQAQLKYRVSAPRRDAVYGIGASLEVGGHLMDVGIEPGPYLAATELNPDRFAPFAVLREHLGFVPNVFRAQGGRPQAIEAEVGAIRLTKNA